MRFQDFWAHILAWIEKNQYDYCNAFLSIDLIMKYRRGMHLIIKFKVSWLPQPESVIQFFTTLYELSKKIIEKNVPWQNLSIFLRVILEKFPVNV